MKQDLAVTIGTFDGIHLGHRELLNELKKMSVRLGCRCAALALERPARSVISNNIHDLITPWSEKIELLKSAGIDRVIRIKFDNELRHIEPRDFFYNVLVAKYKAKGIVVGADFRFGRNKRGNRKLLAELCADEGVAFKAVRKLKISGRVVSSSRIRELLNAGRLVEANRLLGYEYSIKGRIYSDQGLASKLGAPTLNIMPDEHKILPSGVFAAELEYKKKRFKALCYIGLRPTLGKNASKYKKVEVHIPKHVWNSKRKDVTVGLIKKIRDDIKFRDLDTLARMIKKDIEKLTKYA